MLTISSNWDDLTFKSKFCFKLIQYYQNTALDPNYLQKKSQTLFAPMMLTQDFYWINNL